MIHKPGFIQLGSGLFSFAQLAEMSNNIAWINLATSETELSLSKIEATWCKLSWAKQAELSWQVDPMRIQAGHLLVNLRPPKRFFSLDAVVFARKYEQSHGLNIFGGLTAGVEPDVQSFYKIDWLTDYSMTLASIYKSVIVISYFF